MAEPMRPDDTRVQHIGRSVYFDGAEIAHCSDPVSAELIALSLAYIGESEAIPLRVQRRLCELFA